MHDRHRELIATCEPRTLNDASPFVAARLSSPNSYRSGASRYRSRGIHLPRRPHVDTLRQRPDRYADTSSTNRIAVSQWIRYIRLMKRRVIFFPFSPLGVVLPVFFQDTRKIVDGRVLKRDYASLTDLIKQTVTRAAGSTQSL